MAGVACGWMPSLLPPLLTARSPLSSPQVGLVKIWCWESGQSREAANTDGLVKALCDELAWNPSAMMLPQYACYRSLLLMKNLPEWAALRDVAFYAKYFLNTNLRVFPEPAWCDGDDAKYSQRDAELSWGFDDRHQQFVVSAFGRTLACVSTRRHRFPSSAAPSFYTRPHAVSSEDQILHLRSLPSFGGALGQHDSELLLSYLTVPYIRLPLVLSFFASEARTVEMVCHVRISPRARPLSVTVLLRRPRTACTRCARPSCRRVVVICYLFLRLPSGRCSLYSGQPV